MAEYLDPADLVSIPELAGVAGVSKSFNLKKAAQVARSRLVVLAQQRLFTSARDYVKAIQPMRLERGAGGVERYVIECSARSRGWSSTAWRRGTSGRRS